MNPDEFEKHFKYVKNTTDVKESDILKLINGMFHCCYWKMPSEMILPIGDDRYLINKTKEHKKVIIKKMIKIDGTIDYNLIDLPV